MDMISMDIHGHPWISMAMDIHGCPWMSMDSHGYPWISIRPFFQAKNHKTSFVEQSLYSCNPSPTKTYVFNGCLYKNQLSRASRRKRHDLCKHKQVMLRSTLTPEAFVWKASAVDRSFFYKRIGPSVTNICRS